MTPRETPSLDADRDRDACYTNCRFWMVHGQPTF